MIMRKRYFCHDAESDLGVGTVYFEFVGDYATRQVERYGDHWFDSRTPYHPEIGPGLLDQPLTELELGESDEISAEEFEHAWNESVRSSE